MAQAVADEYKSSLADLNFNSKPHINMLTMLAEDNAKFAPLIVQTIIDHINTVRPELKLPGLYLVDSIIKNVGGQYLSLFSQHMITLFASVFEKLSFISATFAAVSWKLWFMHASKVLFCTWQKFL